MLLIGRISKYSSLIVKLNIFSQQHIVPENIQPPTHRFYLNYLKPIWKFQFSLLAVFKNFGFLSPQSSALEIPRPSFGWVWYLLEHNDWTVK